MRSMMICRRIGKAVTAAAKRSGGCERWRNLYTKSSGLGGGKMEAIRSSSYSSSWAVNQMKHQEIEGATVVRDMSEVAKEAREVTETMMKSMYGVSKAVAVVGMTQLGVGAYMVYNMNMTNMSSCVNMNIHMMMAVCGVGFGFPFSMALMMRQSLKSMSFLKKMEEIGRLQLLTSTMQMSKQLRLLFLRLRIISYTSASGLLLSFLYSLLSSSSSS